MTYIQPLILVFGLIALLGLFRLRRSKGLGLAAAGLVGLLLISWPPADWLLSRHLETWYPVRSFPEPAEAIVVLSSSVAPPRPQRPYPLPDAETYARCLYAAWLHLHWKALPVMACGGPGIEGAPFAATMRQVLEQAGVPGNQIWTEERSHSTHENAIYGAAVLRQHRIRKIALVVEAQSMPRAAACFRKQAITVVPAPSSSRRMGRPLEELLPSWRAIYRNEVTLHETLGLAWYWLRGWI